MKLTRFTKSGMLSVLLLCFAGILFSQQIAFPTAEGFGKYTVGGRGGKVYEVTNLNDDGPGSLREAVSASGPRTVVFRVSGTIQLNSNLDINNPYITIAGQTAPGDGICIKKYPLMIRTSEVIIRYIRVRLGDETGRDTDALTSRYNKNIIIDHVSASWSIDETMTLYHNDSVTVQWCLLSESLYYAKPDKGNHGFGGIWGGPNASFHHNLIAHHSSRNPRFASGSGNTDFRNNVIYNWGYQSIYGGENVQKGSDKYLFSAINMVANYYKPGPGTLGESTQYRIVRPSNRDIIEDYGKWYIADNFVYGNADVTADNWNGGVQPDDNNQTVLDYIKSDSPIPSVAIEQQTAEEAYLLVLENSGAILPSRDIVDTRIVQEVKDGTATYGTRSYSEKHKLGTSPSGIIDSQTEVGGWPVLNTELAPDDCDHDGMPDNWEAENGLNKADPEDRNGIGEGGYTNLEIYLNSINAKPKKLSGQNMVQKEAKLDQNLRGLEKQRVIVTSDGEIDDECSIVRFLLYANEWDVEGIITSSSQYHSHGHNWAGDDWLDPYLEAYTAVYPNLIKHDKDYPSPEYLKSIALLGNVETEGEMDSITAGSQQIVKVLLDETDERPIWLQAWGGTNTIARALKTIEEEHPDRMAEVANKMRFFFIWEQDDTYQTYIKPIWGKYNITTIISDQFVALFYKWPQYIPDKQQNFLKGAWMNENVKASHGPLCSLYKSHDNGDFRSEGDSPAFMHAIPTGLRNLENPGWGGWAGRYANIRENTWLDPVAEPGYKYPEGRWYTRTAWGRLRIKKEIPNDTMLIAYLKPIWRWMEAFQNDFASRADWCVKSCEEANHPPVVTLGHSADMKVRQGEMVKLSADGTSDPDGDVLTYRWWQYQEVDTYKGIISIENSERQEASFIIPTDALKDQNIHIVCEVKDNGTPQLTSYQRVIIKIDL